jgi:hypothetical protein
MTKINRQLDRGDLSGDDTNFIGVLDIAGFEMFEGSRGGVATASTLEAGNTVKGNYGNVLIGGYYGMRILRPECDTMMKHVIPAKDEVLCHTTAIHDRIPETDPSRKVVGAGPRSHRNQERISNTSWRPCKLAGRCTDLRLQIPFRGPTRRNKRSLGWSMSQDDGF